MDKDKIVPTRKFGVSSLHNRVQMAEKEKLLEIKPDRIVLMLDTSSSMNHQLKKGRKRISFLQSAVTDFITSCDFDSTSICIETFPGQHVEIPTSELPMSVLINYVNNLNAYGNTPMGKCLHKVSSMDAISRGIIVSDGEASDIDTHDIRRHVSTFVDKSIPIDCVHIGDSSDGEHILEEIASLTGGIYIKFLDIESFSRNFRMLNPTNRPQLTIGSSDEIKKLLGAKDIS